MNDKSITSSGPSSPRLLPGKVARLVKKVGDLFRRDAPGSGSGEESDGPATSPLGVFGKAGKAPAPSETLLVEARGEISDYAGQNYDLLERASRFQTRYERLREEGTPSETVGNRAERARVDFRDGLQTLRDRFVSRYGEEGGRAFDLEAGEMLGN